MSIEALSTVFENSKATGSDLLVLIMLADDYNPAFGAAWPSIKRLCQKARRSQRQVIYSLYHLKKIGEIDIDKGAVIVNGKAINRYRILLPMKQRGPMLQMPKRIMSAAADPAFDSDADSAPVESGQVQNTTVSGAKHDSAYKDRSVKDPLLNTYTDQDQTQSDTCNSENKPVPGTVYCPGRYDVTPRKSRSGRPDRKAVFVGEHFEILPYQHAKFRQKLDLAGIELNEEELGWFYEDRDEELRTLRIDDDVQLWLHKRMTEIIKDELDTEVRA